MSPVRRRDRHGRGLRGRLVPPYVTRGERAVEVPVWRTRAEVFDDLVIDAVTRVARLRLDLGELDVVVHDVPPARLGTSEGWVADGAPGGGVPLAQALAAEPGAAARIVIYRRPIELRAEDPLDLRELLHEVVIDAVAELLGIDPDEV